MHNLTMSYAFVGVEKNMFAWKVTLKHKSESTWSTMYRMGFGHCTRAYSPVSVLGNGRTAKSSTVKIPIAGDIELARAVVGYGNRVCKSDLEGHVWLDAPTLSAVLDSLQSDCQAGDLIFEDFCSDFGYDSDSRKVESIWRACVDTRLHLKRLMGETDFAAFMSADPESFETSAA